MNINQLSPETVAEAKNARQVFLMVAELHKLGYEGLRVTPFHSPSGCYWRCCIVPASMTHRDHGARLADDVDYESLPKYSSADEDNYFGWRNMKPKTPLILARRFIVVFQKFAETRPSPRSGLRPLVFDHAGTDGPDWRGVGLRRHGCAGRPDDHGFLRRWRRRAVAAGMGHRDVKPPNCIHNIRLQ